MNCLLLVKSGYVIEHLDFLLKIYFYMISQRLCFVEASIRCGVISSTDLSFICPCTLTQLLKIYFYKRGEVDKNWFCI